MAQPRINKKSEAFTILQENLSSARDRDMSSDEVEKAIRGNKNLLNIYKEIELSLKKSTDLYKQNRKSLEQINELNRETFKTLKADTVARKQLSEINRQNIKYLDDAQEITRESLKNDIDSKKIKEKIITMNNAIAKSDRERVEQSIKYNETFEDLSGIIERNATKFKSGIGATAYIKDIQALEDSYRDAVDKMNVATTTKTAEKYRVMAEKVKIEQRTYMSSLFNEVEDLIKDGTITKSMGVPIQNKLNELLGEAFQNSNIISSLQLSSTIASKTVKQLENEKKRVEVIEKKVGTYGKVFDGLSKTPLNSLFDFNKAKAGMKDAGGTGGSIGMSAIKSLAGSTPIAQLGLIGGGYSILKSIVELMAKADDRVTRIARSFGIAKSEAGGIYDNAEGTNTELGRIGLNIDDIINAQINFNDAFGYTVNLSSEMLKNIGQATKSIGLSTEATNELIQQSLSTNRDINEVEADILGQLSYQSKGLLGNKNMLEKVLHISGEVRANFKGNVSEIAKAIVKSKEYAMSLEKVNQIGEGLLDWESSISAELEAELITGRQINLEKARYASLMGNTAELMEEINKNVGDFDQFTNMNVLQQKAYATALGMTREEMSNMLFEQSVNAKIISLGNKKYTEDQRTFLSQSDKFKQEYNKIMNDGTLNEAEKMKQLGEIARNNISQLTAQAKFESVLEKIKEKIAQLFGDGAVLDKMADGLIGFMKFFKIIGEGEEKRYLAGKIINNVNPDLSPTSSEYKKLLNTVSGYDMSTLKTKNNIISLQSSMDKNSPEYKQKIGEMLAEESSFGLTLNGNSYGGKGILDVINKLDEVVKAVHASTSKPVQIDSTVQNDAQNKRG